MSHRSLTIRLALPALLVLAWAGNAQAALKACEIDADCDQGFVCARGASSPGCDPSADCAQPDIIEEFGYCERAPQTCETDAECGEYLSCVESNGGDCWVSSDGESGCSEPDPNASKYCSVGSTSCSSDADCPREFECVTFQAECLLLGCAEDEPDCRPCEPKSAQVCQPKQIECEADADCPAEWSCGVTGASGDPRGSDSDSGAAEPGMPMETLPMETKPQMSEPERTNSRLCYPDAWGGFAVTTDSGGLAETDDRAQGSSNGESSNSGGGCSVAAVGASGAAHWLMGVVLLAPWVRRRRSV